MAILDILPIMGDELGDGIRERLPTSQLLTRRKGNADCYKAHMIVKSG
jgi:hypothetical protein